MTFMKTQITLFVLLVSTVPLVAHEFWLRPEKLNVAAGATVPLRIERGEDFKGDVRPFSTARVAALRHYSVAGVVDLIARVPAALEVEALPFALQQPGTHLIALDSTVSKITLSPDKFLSYLNADGLEYVDAARKAAKTDTEPGRERYLRCVKTLVRVGGVSDATYATRTGQRLEIVPTTDPLAAKPGDRLAFDVIFDGKAVEGGLVRAWYHRDGNLVVIKGRTTAAGRIALDLPYAGVWMISLVHMIPIASEPDYDWESYWGNLTFELNP